MLKMCIPVVFFAICLLLYAPYSTAEGRVALSGTFFQPLFAHDSVTPEQWNSLFDELEKTGACELIVQWTLYDEVAFYHSETFKSLKNPPLEVILKAAEDRGIKVHLGLYNSSDYWAQIKRNHTLVDIYMNRIYVKSTQAARELLPLTARYSSFAGWYIPQEIDDVSWLSPEKRDVLTRFLKKTVKFLNRVTPGKQVSVSGFSNVFHDPQSFSDFWTRLLKQSSIDTVYFQDGIGTKKQTLDSAPVYFSAIAAAASANSVRLSVVVEIFRQVSDTPFKAVSAPLEEILQQISIAVPYSQGGITAFSIPEYMSSFGGSDALGLQSEYIKHFGVKSCK